MTHANLNRRKVLGGMVGAAAFASMPPLRAAQDGGAMNFLVVGDWGRQGTNHQRDVAVQMGKSAAALGSRCVVSVGDNFYEDGVASTADPQWHSSFEEIYTAPSLQIPWYVALGNHDYRGSPQAQVEYTHKSARWRMPDRYFRISAVGIGAPHLDLFFIDTSPLVHKYREDVEGIIAANVASQDIRAQTRWLDRELGLSMASWKLVIGHHTLRSGGSKHGETPEVIELIEPLLKSIGSKPTLMATTTIFSTFVAAVSTTSARAPDPRRVRCRPSRVRFSARRGPDSPRLPRAPTRWTWSFAITRAPPCISRPSRMISKEQKRRHSPEFSVAVSPPR